MLQKVKQIIGSHVFGLDGDVGKIKDVYFDDQSFNVRYLVVDTGTWLSSREVLLVPSYFQGTRFPSQVLQVSLTKKQVEDSPPVSSDMPLSRQVEERLHTYFGWEPYWDTPFYPLPGIYSFPIGMGPTGLGSAPSPWSPASAGLNSEPIPDEAKTTQQRALDHADGHLRSFSEVNGYQIGATDGSIGHVMDLLIDSDTWQISHLVVDTRNWLPGRHVVVATHLIKEISWDDQEVAVHLTREEIKHAPEYSPNMVIDTGYQERLAAYYGAYQQSREAWMPTREPPRADI